MKRARATSACSLNVTKKSRLSKVSKDLQSSLRGANARCTRGSKWRCARGASEHSGVRCYIQTSDIPIDLNFSLFIFQLCVAAPPRRRFAAAARRVAFKMITNRKLARAARGKSEVCVRTRARARRGEMRNAEIDADRMTRDTWHVDHNIKK